MIPLGLNEYIDLDNLINVNQLINLHDYLIKAIASSNWGVGANANGREDGKIDSGLLERQYQKTKNEELDGMGFDARQRYFLLKYNAGFLGNSVRVINAPNYLLKHDPSACQLSPDAHRFTDFLKWIDDQDLFVMYGRVVVFITPPGIVHPAHHDYSFLGEGASLNRVDEFIWMRTNLSKQFGLYDNSSPRNFKPINSYTAWFNNDQYHGGPPTPADEWSFSIRIDGIFSDRIRKGIDEIRTIPIG